MNNNFVKKHLLTIICAVAIIAIFLPFITMSTSSEYVDTSKSLSIFDVAFKSLGFLLILGPVLLVSINYVKQLEKYKAIIALVVPAVCLIVLIITFFQAKNGAAAASGVVSAAADAVGASMETKSSIGIGMILAALCYIGMEVVAVITYKSFALNKDSLAALKNAGAGFLENAQAKVSQAAQNVSGTVSGKMSSVSLPSLRSKDRTEEVLTLIEKLAKMKAEGVLTEEEFTEKKRKLLEEI